MEDQFIIEEFKFYKVFLYGRSSGGQTDYGIHINIPSGKAILRFSRDYSQMNSVTKNGNAYEFIVYLRAEKYPAFIDIFRNEKPLFFYYNLDTNESYVTTSDEPVGEEESSND